MKQVIWNCAFCIVVCLAISSDANPQLDLNYSKPLSLSPINTCDSCECGATRMERIVRGERVKERNQFPWLVRLVYNNGHRCGGTIISPGHIITAAHCTKGLLPDLFRIIYADKSEHQVKTIKEHDDFNEYNLDNDIAIIEIMEPYVNFDEGVLKRICLPTEGQDFSGTRAIAAGWGNTREGVEGNKDLNKVILPILSKAECDQSHYNKYTVTENMFCAGYEEGGKATCQGDSGGPLSVSQNGRMMLAGIVSKARGCARAGYPGIYTKVSKYLSWISEHTGGECICVNKN